MNSTWGGDKKSLLIRRRDRKFFLNDSTLYFRKSVNLLQCKNQKKTTDDRLNRVNPHTLCCIKISLAHNNKTEGRNRPAIHSVKTQNVNMTQACIRPYSSKFSNISENPLDVSLARVTHLHPLTRILSAKIVD